MTYRSVCVFSVTALLGGTLGFGLFVRSQSEDQAIATIVRSGGRVYYDFQTPTLATRPAPTNFAYVAPLASDLRHGVLDDIASIPIACGQAPAGFTPAGFTTATEHASSLTASPFTLNAGGATTQVRFDAEQRTTFSPLPTERSELYFSVPRFSGSDDIVERILIDFRRRIECATVGPELDSGVLKALTQLRQLRQLIVYGADRKTRQDLAERLPDVDVYYR